MYNLGIIGLGNFGQKYVETIQQDFPDVNLVAACRQENDRPNWLPESCKFYTNYKDLYNDNLSGVIVATNPSTSSLIVQDLLSNNIPVLAEKPICMDLQSWELIELAAKNTPLLVNYIHLFSPAFTSLQNYIKNKNIISVITNGYNNGPVREFSSLFDYASHDISMILDIAKSYPKDIRCSKTITDNGELFEIMLVFDGFSSYSKVGNGAKDKQRNIRINMDLYRETITYDDTKDDKLVVRNILHGGKARAINTNYLEYDKNTKPLNVSINKFLAQIDNPSIQQQDLNFTKQVISILEECYKQTHKDILT